MSEPNSRPDRCAVCGSSHAASDRFCPSCGVAIGIPEGGETEVRRRIGGELWTAPATEYRGFPWRGDGMGGVFGQRVAFEQLAGRS